MSTITREWLHQTIAEYEANRDELPFGLDTNSAIELQAFKLALASIEAEPVAYSLIFRNMEGVLNDYVNANTTFSTIEKAQAYGRGGNYVEQNDGSLQWVSDPSLDPVVVPLYTAPLATVSVPDAYIRDERGRMMLNGNPEPRIGYGGGWNACRAAMLQGAEPVSNHDESQVVVLHMGQAMSVFEALKKEALSEQVRHTELGEMGAVNVQVWTSVLGGTLQYETSNGGCTLRVIQAAPQQEA